MAKVKYTLLGRDEVFGIIWDMGEGREILVTNGDKLDVNDSLTILGRDGKEVKQVELLEMLNEILPKQ